MCRFVFLSLSFVLFSGVLRSQKPVKATLVNTDTNKRNISEQVLYPNPTSGDFQLKFEWHGSEWQEATLLVFDAHGELIQQEKNLLTEGENIWEETLKTRDSGHYQIEVVLENVLILSEKLILSRN